MKPYPETLQEAKDQARQASKDANHTVYVFKRGNAYLVSGRQLTDTIVTAFRRGKEVKS